MVLWVLTEDYVALGVVEHSRVDDVSEVWQAGRQASQQVTSLSSHVACPLMTYGCSRRWGSRRS